MFMVEVNGKNAFKFYSLFCCNASERLLRTILRIFCVSQMHFCVHFDGFGPKCKHIQWTNFNFLQNWKICQSLETLEILHKLLIGKSAVTAHSRLEYEASIWGVPLTPVDFYCIISFFSNTNITEKMVDFTGFRTQIFRVEKAITLTCWPQWPNV